MTQRYVVQITKGTRRIRKGRFLGSRGLVQDVHGAELYTKNQAEGVFEDISGRVQFKILPVVIKLAK